MGDLQTRDEAAAPVPSRLSLPLRPGEMLDGKYTVTRLIGAGSMGFVFSAERPSLGDEVAIKVLRKEMLSDGQLVARFAREARVAAKIKSEHVACVFDVGHLADGAPFIVMERLEGKDLRWVLAERGALPVEIAVDYILQACEALAIAHANGITHRDIKPENLFASRQAQGDDVIKVLDFGISKMNLRMATAEDKLALVKTTMAMGSPMYMSPEQIRAAKDIDSRSDIWALGCVLYELLSGNPAFSAPSVTELCALILESRPVLLASLGLNVPPELEAVIWRCLEKDPNKRFQTISELAVALSPFAPSRSILCVERCSVAPEDQTSAVELSEVPTVPSFLPPRPPINWMHWTRGVVALGLACVGVALLFSPHADPVTAVAALPQETQLGSAVPVPTGHALSGNALAPPTPPSEAKVEETGPTSAVLSAPEPPVPPKPVLIKPKPRATTASRSKEELDVGF